MRVDFPTLMVEIGTRC